MPKNAYLDSLREIVGNEKAFNIKFYVINGEIERNVESAIRVILEHYGKGDLSGVLYTCVKELMINGTKANLKRVLFDKKGFNIDNDEQYVNGMIEFRNFLNEESYHKFLGDLKSKDYWVNIKFFYNRTGIRMEVINNAHITGIEDRRLREKLKKAMKYDDIVQFYMDQGDEIEGAGMGVALIIMLLKGIQIDPSLFRIGNTPDRQTFARIEVPLNDEFVSVRMRKKGQ